ncbi:hypothetical protein MSG28_014612 [Choristoneura fumiferana]|uniref:Uncharacterized protein n=1 Tax=Choristoneura fumiferana TaxID=7141 RepID=A0ACC0JS59_CHOFU|nr:hypothetical protein MSG28_014612 [Choristoneura fumiferana]
MLSVHVKGQLTRGAACCRRIRRTATYFVNTAAASCAGADLRLGVVLTVTCDLGSNEHGCVLPAYPPHGTYTVDGRPEAVPGQTYDFVSLTVTCDPGLTPHPSVKYYCKITGDGLVSGIRECRELEPHGTVVVPECNRPVYYFSSDLPNMHCVEGTWDYIAVCQTGI